MCWYFFTYAGTSVYLFVHIDIYIYSYKYVCRVFNLRKYAGSQRISQNIQRRVEAY